MSTRSWTAADVRKLGHAMPGDSPKPHKYNARKKAVDGILFDSTREAKRYQELKLMEKVGAISNLRLQPRFVLQSAFRTADGTKHRKMEYVADFQYRVDRELCDTVEDCKGFATAAFKLKWKLVVNHFPQYRFVMWTGKMGIDRRLNFQGVDDRP